MTKRDATLLNSFRNIFSMILKKSLFLHLELHKSKSLAKQNCSFKVFVSMTELVN